MLHIYKLGLQFPLTSYHNQLHTLNSTCNKTSIKLQWRVYS